MKTVCLRSSTVALLALCSAVVTAACKDGDSKQSGSEGGSASGGGQGAASGSDPTAGTANDSGSGGVGTTGGASGAAHGEAGGAAAGGKASGGSTAGGGSAGQPATGSCDDFTCPDLGTCGVKHNGALCVRVCTVPGTHMLSTGDDVAQLAALKCDVFDGSLTIQGNQVGSLTGLGTISEVTGTFYILNNSQASVALPPLRVVGRDLLTYALGVDSIGFPALESVGNELSFGNNPKLASIKLASLQTVPTLSISLNPELVTLDVPALTSVRSFGVTANPKLPQCQVDMLAKKVGGTCAPCNRNDTTTSCQ